MKKFIVIGAMVLITGCASYFHTLVTPEKSFCRLAVDAYNNQKGGSTGGKKDATAIFNNIVDEVNTNESIPESKKVELYNQFDLQRKLPDDIYSKEAKTRMRSFYDDLRKYCLSDYNQRAEPDQISSINDLRASIRYIYVANDEAHRFLKATNGKMLAEQSLLLYFVTPNAPKFDYDTVYHYIGVGYMGLRVQQVLPDGVLANWYDRKLISEVNLLKPIFIETKTKFKEGQVLGGVKLFVYDGTYTYTSVVNKTMTIPKFKEFKCDGCFKDFLFYGQPD